MTPGLQILLLTALDAAPVAEPADPVPDAGVVMTQGDGTEFTQGDGTVFTF